MNAPSWRRTGAGTRRAHHQPGAAQARAQRARMPRRRRRGLRSYRVNHMGSFARHTQSGSRSVSRAQRERSKARPVQLQRHGGFGGSAQIRWRQQLSRRHRTQSAQATGSIQHGHGASHGYVHAALTAGNEQAAVHCGRMDMHSAEFPTTIRACRLCLYVPMGGGKKRERKRRNAGTSGINKPNGGRGEGGRVFRARAAAYQPHAMSERLYQLLCVSQVISRTPLYSMSPASYSAGALLRALQSPCGPRLQSQIKTCARSVLCIRAVHRLRG